jgi:hypothetical protein
MMYHFACKEKLLALGVDLSRESIREKSGGRARRRENAGGEQF